MKKPEQKYKLNLQKQIHERNVTSIIVLEN